MHIPSAQSIEILSDSGLVRWNQRDRRQAQPPQKLPKPQPSEASVEIRKRMDGKQPPFRKSKGIRHQVPAKISMQTTDDLVIHRRTTKRSRLGTFLHSQDTLGEKWS